MYVVRAINVDGVTGTFTAEKNTRREAVELAKRLREQGLWVIITGPMIRSLALGAAFPWRQRQAGVPIFGPSLVRRPPGGLNSV
jgi:hypothetical protein